LYLIAFHYVLLFFLFHSYSCVLGNMVTFHAIGNFELTIMVNNLGTTLVFKQCLCAMFSFHLRSLHVSKDVSYDSNNLVLSLLY
jgi:hypothetical protein